MRGGEARASQTSSSWQQKLETAFDEEFTSRDFSNHRGCENRDSGQMCGPRVPLEVPECVEEGAGAFAAKSTRRSAVEAGQESLLE